MKNSKKQLKKGGNFENNEVGQITKEKLKTDLFYETKTTKYYENSF